MCILQFLLFEFREFQKPIANNRRSDQKGDKSIFSVAKKKTIFSRCVRSKKKSKTQEI